LIAWITELERAVPYSTEHKQKTHSEIIEAARTLFNQKGFHETSIDEIMSKVGLTRGGFYNHFKNKEELYAEAVASFLNGRGKTWRDEAGVDPINGGPETVRHMIKSYLSNEHLDDLEGQCPMIALPSDAARATDQVQDAYEGLVRAMIWLFETNSIADSKQRETALILATLCVGGMVLARTVRDPALSEELRGAALKMALNSVTTDQTAKTK
jgi:AcrR family transcriptional regulator